MAINTTTIPKQHYVTIQYRSDASTESGLLGFASPYTKDSAFQKRKSTQDNWAYGYGVEVSIAEDDSITCKNIGTNSANWRFDAATLFMSKCYPMIINNDPVEGFEVAKSVKRTGWNGGNVVWRIADPRGFELEISSANFARVVDCATIINGVIQGGCVWGRNGKDNILLPISSDVYQEAVTRTVQTNTKVSLKDVQIGDKVRLILSNQQPTELACSQYLGKFHVLCLSYASDNTTAIGSKERYIFKADSGSYHLVSTPKVAEITERIATPLDKQQVAVDITKWSIETEGFGYGENVVLVSPKAIKIEDITMELEPVNHTGKWNPSHAYKWRADPLFCRSNGKYYVAEIDRRNQDNNMREVIIDFGNKKITNVVTTVYGGNSYYHSRGYDTNVVVKGQAVIDAAEKFRMKVSAHGIVGGIYSGL